MGCNITLINTPVTEYYQQHIPNNILKQYQQMLDELNVPLLDLNNILKSKADSTMFRDADHTNLSGDSLMISYLKEHPSYLRK